MISIVIPNYNNCRFISECINSVRNQSHRDTEIIVVDDASTDSSRKLLEKMQKQSKRLKVVFNEKTLGVSKARHQGIHAATMPYITTLDSDDYYLSNNKLEMELQLLKYYESVYQEDVLPFSRTVVVDVRGVPIPATGHGPALREGWIFESLLQRDCTIPRDFLFTSEQYTKSGGYDPNIPLYEDWDFKLRVSRLARFVYTNHNGVAYRQTRCGLSSVHYLKHLKWKNYVFDKNSRFCLNRSSKLRHAIKFKSRLSREFAGQLLRSCKISTTR